MLTVPTPNQKALLKRRGLDWHDYLVVKSYYCSVWFIHKKTGRVKIINKNN